MKRVRWGFAAAATVAALVAGQALAGPAPVVAKPKPTTTRPATTTTVVPTTTLAPTTTAGPTTTTVGPTTTTAASCTPGTPITITTGGTYSGCYRSTDPAVRAVNLATTQPVTFDHARIEHTGMGLEDTVTGTRVTLLDSTFTQLPLGQVVKHRAVELEQPASFTAEHNRLTDGDGIWVGGPTTGPITVQYNDTSNVGRYPHPLTGNCCVQFIQFDHVVTAPLVVAWNRVTNTSGASGVGDNINFYFSGGTSSTAKADVHHNLVDGAYPAVGFDSGSGTGADYVGGGILSGDAGGGNTQIHDNTVVSTTNYGVGSGSPGTPVNDTLGPSNVLVNDTFGSDGVTHFYSNFGQAMTIQAGTGNTASGNSYNWRRDATTSQFPCWSYNGSGCGTNTLVATTEAQARDAWAAAAATAGVTVGPR